MYSVRIIGQHPLDLPDPPPYNQDKFQLQRSKSMNKTNTPFRYDYVGSFLRPAALKQARADFQSGSAQSRGGRRHP